MAQKRRKNCLALLSMLTDPQSRKEVEDLTIACREVLSEYSRKEIDCRHNTSKNDVCFFRGTRDKQKAPCIRRDKIFKRLPNYNCSGKAHLRSYHLSFLSKATYEDVQILLTQCEHFEIRHLCGHNECDNPDHLKLGSVLQNERDKHYHFVLDNASCPEKLLQVFKEDQQTLDIL